MSLPTRTTRNQLRKLEMSVSHPPTEKTAASATLLASVSLEPEALHSESDSDENSIDEDEDELSLPVSVPPRARTLPPSLPAAALPVTPQKSNDHVAPHQKAMPDAPRKTTSVQTQLTPSPVTTPIQMLEQALCLVHSARQGLQGTKQIQVAELANKLQKIINNEFPFQSNTTLLEQLVLQVQKQGKAIAQLSSKTTLTPPPQRTRGQPLSYAQAVETDLPPPPPTAISATTSAPFVTVTRNKASNKRREKEEFQKRQLVLITNEEDQDQDLDPLALRNQINHLFKTQQHEAKAVVASIAKSKTKQNIVLTTTADFDAEYLIEHKEIWESLFKFTRKQKLENWAQIVVHGVPFHSAFLEDNGSAELKQEIETFNDITVVGRPRWLSRKQRETQRAGSIVFAVENEEQRTAILSGKKITIAGVAAKVVKYLTSSPSHQCANCQKFGHATESCRATACRLCAGPHKTLEHQCQECNIVGRPCPHTIPKCVNCKSSHFANSKECENWKAAKTTHHH